MRLLKEEGASASLGVVLINRAKILERCSVSRVDLKGWCCRSCPKDAMGTCGRGGDTCLGLAGQQSRRVAVVKGDLQLFLKPLPENRRSFAVSLNCCVETKMRKLNR